MIKLNNKNITYVALADSNNSIKAPKEIWYADSNNSVKLVYRRKDALIEGEDYEKYHWLKGDGSAEITHKDIDTFEVKVLELDTTGVNYAKGYIVNGGTSFTRLYIGHANPSGNYSGLLIFREVGVVVANYRSPSLNIELGEHIITKNTQTDQICVFTDTIRHIKNATSDRDYVGTDIIFNQLIPNQSLYIGYLSSPNIHNLIPCKLLKPVPKWLDANGIRRQVGECGMIDLVSGKFYGNVNNVGTFTVENYYERKEWLQGRNGAYIDTNYYPIVGTDVFSVHFHYDGTLKNPNGIEQDVFGVNYVTESSNNFIRTFINRANYLSCSYYKYTNSYPTTFQNSLEWDIVDLMIDGSDFKYNANGVNYSFANNDIQQQTCPSPLFVFKNNDNVFNQNCYLHGDISSFKITDTSSNTKMNLIPCTLTMDLPASMDANNIARTKGTSGMWDLVSDRFYGNVANSGTFKAVNLAEGVDYEVHQWLDGDGNSYIDTLIGDLTNVSTITCHFFENNLPLSENRIFGREGNATYDSLMTCGLDNTTQKLTVWIRPNPSFQLDVNKDGDYIEIDLVNRIASSSSQSYSFDSSPNLKGRTLYLFGDNGYNKVFAGRIKSFIIGNKINLIPVKLLRSIPSKYDANGIARQAGECGMYDTVNDVFYGNVASSGTFSVSDDE